MNYIESGKLKNSADNGLIEIKQSYGPEDKKAECRVYLV